MDIFLDYKCNNNCRFCCVRDCKFIKPVNQVIKEIKSAKEVNFTGGEPTLRKDLKDFIEYAGQKKVILTTNGRVFSNKKMAGDLVGAGLNEAVVSVHGNEKTHDYLTQTKGSFNQTIKGLDNLKESVPVRAKILVNDMNYRILPKIVEMLLEKVKGICFIYPIVEGNLLKHLWLVPRFESIEKYLHESIKNAEENGLNAEVLNVPPCFLRGHEKNISKEHGLEKEKSFVKPEACKSCSYNQECSGISKDYVNLKGENVKPVI
ncbi:MAG: radical SAM protein [archaeon]|nr:MAG: radical SAM protein [archaeon]